MGTKTKVSSAVFHDRCSQRIGALARYVTAAETVRINGVDHHVADVTAVYQHSLDAHSAYASAKTVAEVALATRVEADAEQLAMDKGLRGWVLNRFGAGSQAAKDFGFVAKVRRAPDSATKARATALAKATRKARNTMGTRQRAHIKGTLPADAPNANGGSAPVSNGSGTPASGGGTAPR